MSGNYNEDDPNTFDKRKFIWDTPDTVDFLTHEQINSLTVDMELVIDRVETEREFKYLQLRMIIDLLEKLIREVTDKSSDMRQIRKLVGLRVFKKNFVL